MWRRFIVCAALLVAGALLLGIGIGVYFVFAGVSARPQPGAVETFVARRIRDMALAWHTDNRPNPIPVSDEGDRGRSRALCGSLCLLSRQ